MLSQRQHFKPYLSPKLNILKICINVSSNKSRNWITIQHAHNYYAYTRQILIAVNIRIIFNPIISNGVHLKMPNTNIDINGFGKKYQLVSGPLRVVIKYRNQILSNNNISLGQLLFTWKTWLISHIYYHMYSHYSAK